jgi:tRNA modification GTPase
MRTGDTIFALSSARGRAGVCVYRLSGPRTAAALLELAGADLPQPRQATLRYIRDVDGTVIDRGLVLWFKAPASFTGEDVAEFHLHGSPAILDAMTRRLGAVQGLRPAEPGEFARRAFSNGKLDLTEAEGLADLIAAETEQQRRLAMRQFEGGLKNLYETWRRDLIRQHALLEATIDVADEDLPGDLVASVRDGLAALAASMRTHLDDGRRGEIVRDGFTVVILGEPNVGKSSLLNAIAGRDVAIVSSIAGTTRDPVEVSLNLGGYAVTLIDTAGLRDTTDEIENEGIRRARIKARHADLRLGVIDVSHADVDDSRVSRAGPDSRVSPELTAHDALVINKSDLPGSMSPYADPLSTDGPAQPLFHVSARTGDGIPGLLAWIEAQVIARAGGSESMPVTRLRHRQALEAAHASLMRCATLFESRDWLPDLIAEDVRMAARALGRITGRIDVEDLLDVIFGEFCIGK